MCMFLGLVKEVWFSNQSFATTQQISGADLLYQQSAYIVRGVG